MMSVVSHIAPHVFARAHITSKCRDIRQFHIAHVPILSLAAQTQLSTTFYSASGVWCVCCKKTHLCQEVLCMAVKVPLTLYAPRMNTIYSTCKAHLPSFISVRNHKCAAVFPFSAKEASVHDLFGWGLLGSGRESGTDTKSET